jgi:hypothetical protein
VLVDFLRANADIFAWSPSDMPGILREVADVGDSPGGPHKRMGKSHLKPAKSQGQTRLA